MGGDIQGPKGGRYVGGFLQLFDWNAKSRKKLFSSKSDLPEHPKQGKKSMGNFPTTRIRMVDEDEIGATTSIKGSSDYSCASSVTDEEGFGNRAPGVVARLMGLDSLPTPNVLEPYCTPFSDTQSLLEAPFRREDLHFYQEHQIMNSGNLPRNIMEPKHQKLLSRPLEKFQTEILPPKSAKSIPITHHKLLSPIKKPGFVPSKDVAHIMEAAAKIIDPGPQANARTKISSAGSSSVPLKVRELKEKMEASQRLSNKTLESNTARSLKGQSLNKSWNGSVGPSFKASCSTDESSAGAKSKGKSISLAVQAKVNVQRREHLNPSQKNVERVKEEDGSSKSESSNHKISHKKSSVRTGSTVLWQNNQKQNSNLAKENLSSKSLATNLHSRKVVSGDSSHGRQRKLYKDAGSSRVGSKKSSLEGRDGHKDVSLSGARNVPRKKRSIDGNLQYERNDSGDNMLIGKNGKLSQSSSVAGTDVVSFTFTAPMTRSVGGFELHRQLAEESNSLFADNRNKKVMLCPENVKLSSLGFDVGGDSLSVLLEQKLRELTNGIESSKCNFIKAEASSFASTRQNAPLEPQMDYMHGRIFSSLSSAEPEGPGRRYSIQGGEVDECSSTKAETRQLYNGWLPSPVSILEPFALTESCNSSDSTGSNMTEECKQQFSSVLGQEAPHSANLGKTHQLETEMDISDSASSLSAGIQQGVPENSTDWDLGYIKDILSNVELMFKDCVSGRTCKMINPHLFDQLERKREGSGFPRDEIFLERKALFDCVSECVDWRCQRFVGGGCRAWAKGVAMVSRKERLAEEVHKEIQGWRNMRDSMVDELVDKDMSVIQGRWLEFEADESELVVDIEDQILDSLVFEVVADVLTFGGSKVLRYC